MKKSWEIEHVITRYLLGQTSSAEEQVFEEKYASDPTFLTLVEAVEDDLVDAYVRQQLPSTQFAQFEGFFLASPDNRDKVEFAASLMKQLDEQSALASASTVGQRQSLSQRVFSSISELLSPSRLRNPALAFAVAAIVIIVLGVGLRFLIQDRTHQQQSNRVPQIRDDQNEARSSSTKPAEGPPVNQPTEGREPLVRASNQKPPTLSKRGEDRKTVPRPIVASFILNPGVTRSSGEINRIEIPKSTQIIKLRLSIDSSVNYGSYSASLRKLGGSEIWKRSRQNTRSKRGAESVAPKSITMTLPVNMLKKGEYLLTLTGKAEFRGSEIVGDYPFTVAGKE